MAKISEQIQNNTGPLMVLLLVVGAFFIGKLSSQVESLKNANNGGGNQVVQQQADNAGEKKPSVSLDTIKGLFGKDLVKFGDNKKKMLFVEVSDPSCPYCHIAGGKNKTLSNSDPRFKLVEDGGTYKAPVIEMKKLIDQGKASYVWIFNVGHGNGELGAKALYCANEKGKFWQAHDLLYNNDGYVLMNDKVKNDISKAGEMAAFLKNAVDSKFMESCLSSDKYKDRIAADIAVAKSLGVSGTPGFFANDTNYPGAVSFSDMESVVNSALK